MKKSIDFTKAIMSGKLTFEQACALQGVGMTDAIKEGILTFEEACELQGMSVETTVEISAPAPKAPKAPKAKKPKKTAKKAPKKQAVEPKAEPEAKAPVYTKGGAIIQKAESSTLVGKEKAKVSKAMNALEAQGFTVEWKRVGSWLYIYQTGEKRLASEYKAATLDKGWEYVKGAWVYKDLCKDYSDNFRPEK